jgi:hypothetical protein
MQSYPLTNLIRNRSFDRYQDGLESRFAAYRFDYKLSYGELSDNSAMLLDFEYKKLIGRMTVWESGECYLEVLEIETSKSILSRHYQLSDERSFHQLLADFFLYFRDGKDLPTQ